MRSIQINKLYFFPGFLETPKRQGKVKHPEHFDAAFFGFPPKLANVADPRHRLLLETVYESIVDAGYNPNELRGSKTGISYKHERIFLKKKYTWFFMQYIHVSLVINEIKLVPIEKIV